MAKGPSTKASAQIPNIVKHTTMAIFQDPNIRGNSNARFETAMKYAVSRLSEYGFLTSDSKEARAEKVKLTTKGEQRNRFHNSEGLRKSTSFDKLYEAWIAKNSRDTPSTDRDETQAPPPVVRKNR